MRQRPDLRRPGLTRIVGSAFAICHLVLDTVSLSWSELARRTWREVVDDDVLGLAAQLSYYFFLALFPAILFLLARRELLSSLEHHGRCRSFPRPVRLAAGA